MNNQTAALARTPTHEEWELRVQDWIDGQADPAEARVVESHVAGCADCSALADGLRELDQSFDLSPNAQPTPDFDRALFARVDAEEAERRKVRESNLAAETTARREFVDRSLRKGLFAIFGIVAVTVLFLAWVLVTGPFGLTATTIAIKIASVSPMQWLAFGTAAAIGVTAIARSIYS